MRSVVGSVLVHGGLLGLLLWIAPDPARTSSPDGASNAVIELEIQEPIAGENDIEIETRANPTPNIDVRPRAAAASEPVREPGGGRPSGAAQASTAPSHPASNETVDAPTTPTDIEVPDTAPAAHAQTGAVAGTARLLGSMGSGLGGSGGGVGRGRGAGTGDGLGESSRAAARARLENTSKARPARLIYPTRMREEREEELFIVVLKVDADGLVDGVRLHKGVDPHSDEKALSAVWRFRYDPARDDDGRPISSRVVQRFLID